MRRYILFILIVAGVQSFAQTDAGQKSTWILNDSISGGKLSIELDGRLENLLKSKEQAVCKKNVYVPPKKLSPADKCATQQKIMGYKIQIFYTKDRATADKVKNDFAKQHPNLTPELIYASPDWRILVGDYFTRQSANSDLRRIQRTYPAAFAVQWRVWCRKAI